MPRPTASATAVTRGKPRRPDRPGGRLDDGHRRLRLRCRRPAQRRHPADLAVDAVTVTHYVYDTFGQATDITVAYGTADASTTRRTYDVVGRVLTETRGFGSAAPATTSYSL